MWILIILLVDKVESPFMALGQAIAELFLCFVLVETSNFIGLVATMWTDGGKETESAVELVIDGHALGQTTSEFFFVFFFFALVD